MATKEQKEWRCMPITIRKTTTKREWYLADRDALHIYGNNYSVKIDMRQLIKELRKRGLVK